MTFMIGLPILIIVLCLLYAVGYSLIYEWNEPLLLKPKYRKKH